MHLDKLLSFLVRCVGATIGGERTPVCVPERPSHVILLILFFRFLVALYLRTTSRKSTQRCYHTALGRPYFNLFLVTHLCLQLFLFCHHHWQPRGRRYYTKPRNSAHVYKIALLLI